MTAPSDAPPPALGELARSVAKLVVDLYEDQECICSDPASIGDECWYHMSNARRVEYLASLVEAAPPESILQLVALATGGAAGQQQDLDKTAKAFAPTAALTNQPQAPEPSREAIMCACGREGFVMTDAGREALAAWRAAHCPTCGHRAHPNGPCDEELDPHAGRTYCDCAPPASDAPAPPREIWGVLFKRDAEPIEWMEGAPAEMLTYYDRLAVQWTGVVLCRVLVPDAASAPHGEAHRRAKELRATLAASPAQEATPPRETEPTKMGVRVCGVDCHPGDAHCNNYCRDPKVKQPPSMALVMKRGEVETWVPAESEDETCPACGMDPLDRRGEGEVCLVCAAASDAPAPPRETASSLASRVEEWVARQCTVRHCPMDHKFWDDVVARLRAARPAQEATPPRDWERETPTLGDEIQARFDQQWIDRVCQAVFEGHQFSSSDCVQVRKWLLALTAFRQPEASRRKDFAEAITLLRIGIGGMGWDAGDLSRAEELVERHGGTK